jgi:hypothetical protein
MKMQRSLRSKYGRAGAPTINTDRTRRAAMRGHPLGGFWGSPEMSTLRVGDVIHIRGHTTDFSQKVESLEVNHTLATEVGPNDDFGLKVVGHVREHDVVYKVRP